MALLSPKLFDPSSLEENILNLPKIWKISTPSKNSLYWSLTLSYVISSEKSGQWPRRYELLLGSDPEIEEIMRKKKMGRKKPDKGKIKNNVLNFNPFRSRSSIYYNENMSDVFRIFDLRLKRYANTIKTKEDQWGDSLKLKAASKMLQCQVVVITECSNANSGGNSGKNTVHTHGADPKNDSPQIIIFLKNDVQKGDKIIDAVFSFGISLEHSIPLRLDAMEHFLKRAAVNSDTILQIRQQQFKTFQYDSNFLLFLLTRGWKIIVPLIYKSPYIAWKLADAGFITDPCCIRLNKKSAFFYCMSFESTRILQILYNYAVNNFQQSDESIRNPNNAILECLKKVGRSIKNDCENSESFSHPAERKDAASETCRDILLLNEFQSCVVEEICGILQNTDHTNIHRKQIVISILDNYFSYFNHKLPLTFDNHIKFRAYFENLDNYTCLMFFDKILSLNPATIGDNFPNAVLNLYLTVISYKVFPKCKHGAHCSKCQLADNYRAMQFISFNHRNEFEKYGKLYMAELQNSADATVTDSNKMLENIRFSLKDSPEITDEFLIKRLERYLKTAKEVSLDGYTPKGILVIERAMQVIGETLKTPKGSKSVIGHLLIACLSNDIVHELFTIRNQVLSHYHPNIMQGRINLEYDKKRFKTLQSILATLDNLLQPVYISQEFRVEEFLIRKNEEESQRISTNIFENIRTERKIIELVRKDQYLKHKSNYRLLSNNVLNYIKRLIQSNKFKKANELSGALEAIKFVFSFIARQCEVNDSQDILKYVQEFDSLIATDNEITSKLKDEMIENISKQICVIANIFKDTKPDKELSLSNLSELHKYFEDVKYFQWFIDKEISTVQKEVLVYLEESTKTKKDLIERIEKNVLPTDKEIKVLSKKLFTNAKNKEVILTKFQTNPKNALKLLRAIKNIDENNIFKDVAEFTVFSEKEEGRNLLLSISFSGDLKAKMFRFQYRNLQCLLNRIAHLKKILIEEDDDITTLWKWGRSIEIKKHTRFLMGQRYMKEKYTRESLEMLLFDCMNILIDRKDLEQLWTKTTNLFSGVCLRDVLSHGSTILETVGGLLDPEDLPLQLIDKVLELIEDGEALQALSDFCLQKNPKDLKQLKEWVIDGGGNKKSIEGRIMKCEKWEAYLQLLPFK